MSAFWTPDPQSPWPARVLTFFLIALVAALANAAHAGAFTP